VNAITAKVMTINLAADINLTSMIMITNINGLVINGNGFKIDGQSIVRCFSIAGASTNVTMNSLTISNGLATGITPTVGSGGALYISDHALVSLNSCSVLNSQSAVLDGGGVYVGESSTLVMNACSLFNNRPLETAERSAWCHPPRRYRIALCSATALGQEGRWQSMHQP
jgi:hypothetical protein